MPYAQWSHPECRRNQLTVRLIADIRMCVSSVSRLFMGVPKSGRPPHKLLAPASCLLPSRLEARGDLDRVPPPQDPKTMRTVAPGFSERLVGRYLLNHLVGEDA